MASVVDICNGALNQLGASTILSLTEDSKNARLCNARYTQVRDSLFRSHPWNCLIKRVELAKDTALAADIAYAVTSSNPTASNMYNLFQDKLKEARFVDATEGQNTNPDNGQSDVIGASSFINARY
jgi:hypothetical protein